MFSLNEKFNFKIGQPPDELMFPEYFENSVKDALSKINDKSEKNYTYRFLNYGEQQGDISLRKELATFLTNDLMYSVSPDNLLISGGVSQGFEMIASIILKPGDNVLIEGPTYFCMIQMMKDKGVNIFTTQRNEDGTLDLNEVETLIKEKNIKMMYIIPTSHNPIGCHIPLEQRNRLYNFALTYKFYLVCDDIYEFFFYDQGKTRITPVFNCSDEIVAMKEFHRQKIIDYQPSNNPFVISLNSFNKLINPGMRVGWILADTSIINKVKSLGWLSSGGGVCNTMSHIVRSYMQLGYFEKIIEATRKEFGDRAKKCDEILKGSKAYTYDFPSYGYFFWIKLSDSVNLDKLKSAMLKEDCHAFFGDFLIHEEAAKQEKFQYLKRRMRLCFVRYSLDRVLEGFSIMRKILEESVEITKF